MKIIALLALLVAMPVILLAMCGLWGMTYIIGDYDPAAH